LKWTLARSFSWFCGMAPPSLCVCWICVSTVCSCLWEIALA
jgi:hypothetical protein